MKTILFLTACFDLIHVVMYSLNSRCGYTRLICHVMSWSSRKDFDKVFCYIIVVDINVIKLGVNSIPSGKWYDITSRIVLSNQISLYKVLRPIGLQNNNNTGVSKCFEVGVCSWKSRWLWQVRGRKAPHLRGCGGMPSSPRKFWNLQCRS
jgi:hypothetical protein